MKPTKARVPVGPSRPPESERKDHWAPTDARTSVRVLARGPCCSAEGQGEICKLLMSRSCTAKRNMRPTGSPEAVLVMVVSTT